MYVDIVSVLRKEITKWLKVDCVPENDIHATQRKYPYIAYYMYNDWQQFDFDANSPDFNASIQFKVVSDDEVQQKELKYQLRRLFLLAEPKEFLREHGLALLKIDDLPSPINYIENAIIYDDGWDMTFNAHFEDTDYTILSTIDTVSTDFEDKEEED